jgi:hypothetical protein
LCDLTGLKIVNLDLSALHIYARICSSYGDLEMGAFDHSGKVGCLDFKMLDVTLLNIEQD